MSKWYVEYAIGSVANRNHIVEKEQFPEIVKVNLGEEVYRSMFLYDEGILDHVKENKTVSNYQGVQSIDRILFDIDKKEDGSVALYNTSKFIDELHDKEVSYEAISLWFSGRGFHVVIPDYYNFEPNERLAEQVKLSLTKDWSDVIDPIYDSKRLIRAPYSLNMKTSLFKVPLSLNEIKSLDYGQICEKAMHIRTDYKHLRYNKEISRLWEPADISRASAPENRGVFKDAKAKVTPDVTCSQHIMNAGPVNGMRHKALLRLVSVWRRKGFDSGACMALGQRWTENSDNPLNDDEIGRIVTDVFRKAYEYGCHDEILHKYCDERCRFFAAKDFAIDPKIMNAEKMIDIYTSYLENDLSKTSFNLKDIFGFMYHDYIFKGGDLVVMIGDTKLGKTAFIQYVVCMVKHMKTLFMSLEVDEITMSRRFMQTALGLNKHEINEAIENKDLDKVIECKNQLSHISLTCSSPDITDYKELIVNSEAGIIVIDTIDAVPAKFVKNEMILKQEYIINQLKEIAISTKAIIFVVSHISKGASNRLNEGSMLDIHSGKGSSVLEQKADKIIAFETSEAGKNRRIIRALGSRDEQNFNITCNFNYEKFRFETLK